jgi:hypothetical protein
MSSPYAASTQTSFPPTQLPPWRTQKEIAPDRQQVLRERLAAGVAHPFAGEQLKRDDVEWLLMNFGDKKGPVESSTDPTSISPTVNSHWGRNGLDLSGAILVGQDLSGLPLGRLQARATHLQGADLRNAHLNEADLREASFLEACLQGTNLRQARLEGADLSNANVAGADLTQAVMDSTTRLTCTKFAEKGRLPYFAGLQWGGAPLADADLSTLTEEGIGDVQREPDKAQRAYGDLAGLLFNQKRLDPALRFTRFRLKLERKELIKSGHLIRYLSNWFFEEQMLGLVAYGYKPWRIIGWYLGAVGGFTALYYALGQQVGPTLSPLAALVMSITSSFGRGFFPGPSQISLDHPMAVAAAGEAIVGLVIDGVFIALLTHRLFFFERQNE